LYFLAVQDIVLTSGATPNFKSQNFAVQILASLPPELLTEAAAKATPR